MPHGRPTCRDEILRAFERLERRHGRTAFDLQDIVQEVQRATDAYAESTIRTQVSSVMCAQAPVNHANASDDLDRVGRGRYRRR
jgi:hypothetical protein